MSAHPHMVVDPDEATLKRAVEDILVALNNRADHHTALLGCVHAIGCILASMTCVGCRNQSAARIEDEFPGILRHHLAKAPAPSPSRHIH
jgi:hypothetical protein